MALFQKLQRDYPTSKNRRQYDFLVELSAVREAVYAQGGADALEHVLQFLEINKNDPLLKDFHGDVWRTLVRLARDLIILTEQKGDADLLMRAKRSWAEAAKLTPPAGTKFDEVAKALAGDFMRLDNLLAASV